MWMKRGFTSLFLTFFTTEWNEEQKENIVLFGLLTEINRMIKLERSFDKIKNCFDNQVSILCSVRGNLSWV